MSKFDEKLRILQIAKLAETALDWFKEDGQSVTFSCSVNGYATEGGKNATLYLNEAAARLKPLIVAKAKEIAEADLERGENV